MTENKHFYVFFGEKKHELTQNLCAGFTVAVAQLIKITV